MADTDPDRGDFLARPVAKRPTADAMVLAPCPFCGGPATDTMNDMVGEVITAALAPLLDDRDQWRNTAQLAENERRSWQSRAETAEAENERLRVQLAGCGVAAMGNTRESLERNRLSKDAYGYSESYADCLRAAEREIAEREGKEAAERDARELRKLLAEAVEHVRHGPYCAANTPQGKTQGDSACGCGAIAYLDRIDAALATPSGAPDSGEAS
jgi:hypothetical protein